MSDVARVGLSATILVAAFSCAQSAHTQAQEKAAVRPKAQKAQVRVARPAQVLRPAVGIAVARPQIQDPIKHQKQRYLDSLLVHIDEIDRICTLSESQRRKLDLAAKGAVVTAMEEWKAMAKSVQDRMGGRIMMAPVARPARNGQGAAEEREDGQAEEEPELRINPQVLSILNSAAILPEPHHQSRWSRAVGSVLSDDQQAKLKNAQEDRRRNRRMFGVASHVDHLDQILRFSPEQRQKATQIVDSVMGAFVESEVPPGRSFYVYGDVPAIREKHLKPILSAAQAVAWKRYVKERNDPTNRIMVGPGFRRAMPINRGPALPPVTLGMAYVTGAFGTGIRVDYLTPDGPAEKAGLRLRDNLKSIDGTPIQSWVMVNSALQTKTPGSKVALVVARGGKEHTFEVTLAKRDPEEIRDANSNAAIR